MTGSIYGYARSVSFETDKIALQKNFFFFFFGICYTSVKQVLY